LILLAPVAVWSSLDIVNNPKLLNDIFNEQDRVVAPNFILNDVNGNPVALSDFQGKVVILHFWTTWCSWCVKEMPSLEKLYNDFKDREFVILGINIGENKEVIEKHFQSGKMSYPVLMDVNASVTRRYGVDRHPAHFVIDAEGKVVGGQILGAKDWDKLESRQFVQYIIEKG
jgi:peroxiredoxin